MLQIIKTKQSEVLLNSEEIHCIVDFNNGKIIKMIGHTDDYGSFIQEKYPISIEEYEKFITNLKKKK